MTEAERDTEAELEALRSAVLDDWAVVVGRAGREIQSMQQTLSWRVTKPLRLVRRLDRVRRERGVVETGRLVAVELARRIGNPA